MKVVVHVDGGARGNPGPAAVGIVISTPEGEVLDEASAVIGDATNNVAEYRALLLGLERARALGASEVDVVNDSELVARQIGGEYKVKQQHLKPLRDALPQVVDALLCQYPSLVALRLVADVALEVPTVVAPEHRFEQKVGLQAARQAPGDESESEQAR